MKFEELNLAPAIVKAVLEQGYETPTAIQAQAIPAVLEGHDLLGGAQTGTGKTAAFVLPMLHKLSISEAPRNKFGGIGIRALVLTPCLLYTSDAADDLLCVDLGGRRII